MNNTRVAFEGIEKKYQTAEKQKQILVLQNDKKQQQLTLQKNHFVNVLLIMGLAFLLLLLLFGWRFFRSRQRESRQEQAIREQQIRELEQTQRLNVYDAMLQGEERERKRLATDLHDGLGAMLSGIKLNLSGALLNNNAVRQQTALKDVIHQLDDSLKRAPEHCPQHDAGIPS